MIIHLINNCAWLLYHKMIPLCIVYDITCHISGFHSCVWALYPNLYTTFSICSFCSFCKNRSSHWSPLNLLFDSFSLTRRIFQFSQILQYSQFSQFSQKSQFSLGPSQPLPLQVFTDFLFFANFAIFAAACKPGHISWRVCRRYPSILWSLPW